MNSNRFLETCGAAYSKTKLSGCRIICPAPIKLIQQALLHAYANAHDMPMPDASANDQPAKQIGQPAGQTNTATKHPSQQTFNTCNKNDGWNWTLMRNSLLSIVTHCYVFIIHCFLFLFRLLIDGAFYGEDDLLVGSLGCLVGWLVSVPMTCQWQCPCSCQCHRRPFQTTQPNQLANQQAKPTQQPNIQVNQPAIFK